MMAEWCEILLEIYDESEPFASIRFQLAKIAQSHQGPVPNSPQINGHATATTKDSSSSGGDKA